MKYNIIAIIFISVLIVACKGEKKLTDPELMEKNVRAFFFMGDSVEVEVTIIDTIHTDKLSDMRKTVEENTLLIQLDIDTLELMVDDWNYKAMDFEKNNQINKSKEAKIKALEYKLKKRELEFKQAQFGQTNRILLRLQRSTWANISGFDANVHYELGDEVVDMEILMDANFNVVD